MHVVLPGVPWSSPPGAQGPGSDYSPRREVITAVGTQLAPIWAFLARYRDEDGQGLAEYALILALIAVVAIVAVMFFGSQVSDKLTIIGNTIASPQP